VSAEQILFEKAPPLAFITFNRPEARNAMSWDMYNGLLRYGHEAEANRDICVLILKSSTPNAFVSGTDIAHFKEFSSPKAGIEYEQKLDTIIDSLETLNIPTIAQIEGVAAGGGCAIAAACDLRICTPKARLGVPIARTLGNCLSIANYSRFLDLIGPTRLKELMFTGRLLTADEALSAGLINKVVESKVIAEVVRATAMAISQNAPLTIRATKIMLNRIQASRRLPPEKGHDLVTSCYASQDFQNAVTAFFKKEKPDWKGT
tara:strand:+ start:75 stop:860 length:786 start_codon:yes stop_codon:yes gene_type:complete